MGGNFRLIAIARHQARTRNRVPHTPFGVIGQEAGNSKTLAQIRRQNLRDRNKGISRQGFVSGHSLEYAVLGLAREVILIGGSTTDEEEVSYPDCSRCHGYDSVNAGLCCKEAQEAPCYRSDQQQEASEARQEAWSKEGPEEGTVMTLCGGIYFPPA